MALQKPLTETSGVTTSYHKLELTARNIDEVFTIREGAFVLTLLSYLDAEARKTKTPVATREVKILKTEIIQLTGEDTIENTIKKLFYKALKQSELFSDATDI